MGEWLAFKRPVMMGPLSRGRSGLAPGEARTGEGLPAEALRKAARGAHLLNSGAITSVRRLAIDSLNYDDLVASTLLHGSPATVIAKLPELRHKTGLRLFAEKVMPELRPPASQVAVL